MKKIMLTAILVLTISAPNIFAIPMKFDLSLSGNVSKIFGLQHSKITEGVPGASTTNPINMSLQAFNFGGGVTFDFIFLTENKPYYGMALSVYAGFSAVQQNFGSQFMTNGQTSGFNSNDSIYQTLSTMQFEIAPMFRFYPTRDFSIAVGPVINVLLNRGNFAYLSSPIYTNEITGVGKYYIQPMFGSIYISAMIDAQVTKFFGNFGIFGGLNIKLLFVPFSVGIGAQVGVKYRFEP